MVLKRVPYREYTYSYPYRIYIFGTGIFGTTTSMGTGTVPIPSLPLSVGNVLGAETRRPILKWESIIRKALNKSQEQTAIHSPRSRERSGKVLNNLPSAEIKATVLQLLQS
ncbi:putative inositol-polyphosphate 5-phosphatase [Helianthus annuus]|nr:putative inositol-polyphosphate 5-phosphatase [Helianthus annuus]KAJ0598492.1 putative inositol-polyphosphate 5-phosphatase [Helianthus annuus]